jgi:hypothetical protein
MKSCLLRTFAVLLVTFAFSASRAVAEDASPGGSCIIHFDQPAKPLNPDFLGANTTFFPRPYDFTAPDVVKLTQDLNLQNVRFPGGAQANWFDWKTGTFFTQDILNQRVSPDRAMKNPAVDERDLMAKYHPAFTVAGMAGFCQQCGADPVWTANLYSGTPQEAADWVAYNKQHGYPNKFWELGNEFYLSVDRSKFPTVQDYIKTARETTAEMKAADPTVQIGIIATENRPPAKAIHGEGEWIEGGDNAAWNDAIAKESFYDAIIVHEYFLIRDEIVGKSEDEVHRYLMARTSVILPELVDYYHKKFGDKVQIWVTEWNLNPYLKAMVRDNPKMFPKDLRVDHYWMVRTVDHALYVADWYLQALRFPETIKVTDLHVLAGQGHWGLFQLPAPEKDNTDKKFLINSPYYAVSWVGDAMHHADSYVSGQVEGAPMLQGGIAFKNDQFPGVVAGAFFKNGKITSVIMINKTSSVQHASFKGSNGDMPPTATVHCLTGNGPLEGWGQDKAVANEDLWRPEIDLTNTMMPTDKIALPPDSLTYAVFK